jgi:hypothetical protein
MMTPLATVFLIAAVICMLGVVVVFVRGIGAMTGGKDKDHERSNKMMRWRVIFQAGALLFLLLAYLAR